MAIIYTNQKSKKQKKKPGWKKEAEEYAEWLSKHAPNPQLQKELRKASKTLTSAGLSSGPRQQQNIPSRSTGTKITEVIHDPRVKYKDEPEMLERELKARERKFTTAPIYNKGGAQLLTDDMVEELKTGSLRRR